MDGFENREGSKQEAINIKHQKQKQTKTNKKNNPKKTDFFYKSLNGFREIFPQKMWEKISQGGDYIVWQ